MAGGGKAAAAADLARARGVQLDTTDEPVDEQRVANATAVLRTGDALLNALRTYDESHPALLRFRDKLDGDLAAFFARDEELTFGLDARAILVDGVEVQRAERIDANIWFPLFAAGIRELTFLEGIDSGEVTRLFHLLIYLRDMPAIEEGEDDAVTLLWQAELECVDFYAVDSFSTGEGGAERLTALRDMFEENTVKESRELAGDQRQRRRTVALTRADVDVLRSENLTALEELPDEADLAQMPELEATRLAQFAAACVTEPTVVERYVDALLGALEAAPERGDPILAQLRDLFTAVIADGRYARGRAMIEQILEAGGAVAHGELERKVIAPETVAKMVRAAATAAPDDATELIALMRRLSDWAAEPAVSELAALSAIERPELTELIAGWGEASQRALTRVILGVESEHRAVELVRLAIRIGGDALVATLRAALQSRHIGVRANALRALTRAAPPHQADAAAVSAVSDPDHTVRHLALEHVIQFRLTAAAQAIGRLVETAVEGGGDELNRLFVAHAVAGGGAAAEWLLARLRQRSLFGKSGATEERIAAAGALGFARCEKARADLEKIAGSRLAARALRDACAEAVALLDRPAPRPPDRARRSRPITTSPPPVVDPVAREPETGPVFSWPAAAPPPRPAARISFREPGSKTEPPPVETDEPAPAPEPTPGRRRLAMRPPETEPAPEPAAADTAETDTLPLIATKAPSDSLELLLTEYLEPPEEPPEDKPDGPDIDNLLASYLSDDD